MGLLMDDAYRPDIKDLKKYRNKWDDLRDLAAWSGKHIGLFVLGWAAIVFCLVGIVILIVACVVLMFVVSDFSTWVGESVNNALSGVGVWKLAVMWEWIVMMAKWAFWIACGVVFSYVIMKVTRGIMILAYRTGEAICDNYEGWRWK